MSRVGEKIKEARVKSGMTQKALAKKLREHEVFKDYEIVLEEELYKNHL